MSDHVHQEPLWHDTIEDALRSVVDGLGGFKKVGAILWPSLPSDDAGRKLAKSLDRARPEKLSFDELLMILKLGRDAGVHVGMAFITQTTGYETPQPSDPITEKEKLQREFVHSVRQLSRIEQRLEQLDQHAPKLRPVG